MFQCGAVVGKRETEAECNSWGDCLCWHSQWGLHSKIDKMLKWVTIAKYVEGYTHKHTHLPLQIPIEAQIGGVDWTCCYGETRGKHFPSDVISLPLCRPPISSLNKTKDLASSNDEFSKFIGYWRAAFVSYFPQKWYILWKKAQWIKRRISEMLFSENVSCLNLQYKTLCHQKESKMLVPPSSVSFGTQTL